ncbi:MAG: hypothetical protein U1E36_05320 [Rickettsiales bacterium]
MSTLDSLGFTYSNLKDFGINVSTAGSLLGENSVYAFALDHLPAASTQGTLEDLLQSFIIVNQTNSALVFDNTEYRQYLNYVSEVDNILHSHGLSLSDIDYHIDGSGHITASVHDSAAGSADTNAELAQLAQDFGI